MPSGESNLIWDKQNVDIVHRWWGKCTPLELQGAVNYRQWKLERKHFASLGGILYQAVRLGKIAEVDAHAYKRQYKETCKKVKSDDGFVDLSLGINVETKRPMAETICALICKTDPETNTVAYRYQVAYPSERATWRAITPEELAMKAEGAIYATA